MPFVTSVHQKLDKYRLVLGSTSPRRKEILETNFGISKFDVIGSNFAENLTKSDKTPLEYVILTSQRKAEALVKVVKENYSQEDIILITCDTVVSCNGEIFEKPGTKIEQARFFKYYSRYPKVNVISAVTIIKIRGSSILEFQNHCITKLEFKSNNEDVMNGYIDSEEGLEVAGGFKFQERGCLLFKEITGDYLNIVGLPTYTYDLLKRALE
ncbi:hypothetical protein KGF56_000701 [Candida oxycetoniae]|uniref:Maf-like protein n=1 Tax=Candida oxycetoniae TaxID=497107 RepID=A0AAI9T1D7_9ASCO|nr:uncharacterized protein KGF56_000701 [Candida oxycetoniae]KAI3406569.2 hypothetical protein KGF56_000701 [Candida oxycetoniae]